MKIDKSLAKEIKAANGDGSREAKFDLLVKVRSANLDLSRSSVMSEFNQILCRHGRVPVAICLGATILARRDRLSHDTVAWANDVVSCWTNRPPSLTSAVIDDGLHPSRIEEYAGSFISCTTA